MDDVVKMTVFMTDLSRFSDFAKVRAEKFPSGMPASTVVSVNGLLLPDLLLEVEAIAKVESIHKKLKEISHVKPQRIFQDCQYCRRNCRAVKVCLGDRKKTKKAISRPNIVFILADDMGYGDLACQNPESKIPTPNLDQLATEGMRFTEAHSPSAVCSPTTRYTVSLRRRRQHRQHVRRASPVV